MQDKTTKHLLFVKKFVKKCSKTHIFHQKSSPHNVHKNNIYLHHKSSPKFYDAQNMYKFDILIFEQFSFRISELKVLLYMIVEDKILSCFE